MNESIVNIEELLRRRFRSHREVAEAGMKIFLLTQGKSGSHADCVAMFREKFLRAVDDSGLGDVLVDRIEYAARLAGYGGDLGYEEMHKLFSLAAEIYVLRQFGLQFSAPDLENLENVMRGRFSKQRRAARMTAEDKVEEWNRELWWFRENA